MLNVHSAFPAPSLRPFIRAYVQREAWLGSRELVEPVVARLGVMLEFEFAGAYEVRNYGSDALEATFPISVIGPQTWRRARLIIRGHVESLVVMFQPAGFHALCGIPTFPLSETGTEGHSLLGPGVSRLHQRLGNLRSFADRVQLLNRYFAQLIRSDSATNPAYKALHRLAVADSGTQVSELARHAGMSIRQLERKSLAYSGMSPKTLARIARFNRALRFHADGKRNWTETAHMAGYHDHMHLVRDFRIFAGDAPTSALQEIAPEHLIHFARDRAANLD